MDKTLKPLTLKPAAAHSLIELLRDLEEYFDERADCDDGIPNKAMNFLTAIQLLIQHIEDQLKLEG
jgi:hypothetical protein